MKKVKAIVLSLLLACCGANAYCAGETGCPEAAEARLADAESRLPIADPYIMLYKGTYYAYGTSTDGFEVYKSTDLKRWTRGGQLALSPKDSWGKKWFWAPEVYYIKSKKKFYMFYSVEEHICVATSDSPEGPFVQDTKEPIWEEKSIDTSLFIDDDGTPYLYFVRFTDGNVVWVAEMTSDLKHIKRETLTQCVKAEAPWELKLPKVAEGPSVMKRKGTYYLIYSANGYTSQDYAVGYATAKSPYGPWKKYEGNPILVRGGDVPADLVGLGHGAPFRAKDKKYRYVFHAHWSKDEVHPRTSYIYDFSFSKDGVITIGGDLIRPEVVE